MGNRPAVMPQGFVAGMIGYAVIVLAYAAINVLQGLPPWATAASLGSHLTGPGPHPGSDTQAAVIAFNGVHLVISILAGLILSWIVAQWESRPGAGYFFFFILLAGLILGSFLSAIIIAELAQAVGWIVVISVNLLAAAGMVGFLFAARPQMRERIPRLVG